MPQQTTEGYIMELFIALAAIVLFAWIASQMAKTRNRNQTTWAILGVLFGVFAIIALALMGKAKEVEAQ
jgi:predicted PurR-regulated permease PerM